MSENRAFEVLQTARMTEIRTSINRTIKHSAFGSWLYLDIFINKKDYYIASQRFLLDGRLSIA